MIFNGCDGLHFQHDSRSLNLFEHHLGFILGPSWSKFRGWRGGFGQFGDHVRGHGAPWAQTGSKRVPEEGTYLFSVTFGVPNGFQNL